MRFCSSTMSHLITKSRKRSQALSSQNDEPLVGVLFFLGGGAMPSCLWDLSSPARDQTCAPCIGSMETSFSFKFIYFIYLFLAALGLCCRARAFSSCSEQGYSLLPCAGFSLLWLLLLRSTASRRAGFSSCGARAQLLRSMWDLTGPGLKPVTPALAGGFLTTAPPGKSPLVGFALQFYCSLVAWSHGTVG